MINLLTLFYSFSGLVPGTGPRSRLHKLGDKDLCCVGVETLNHLQHTYVSHRTRLSINHSESAVGAQRRDAAGTRPYQREFGFCAN